MNTIVRQHLAVVFGAMLLALATYLLVAPVETSRPANPDLAQAVAWLSTHPADWRTAAKISDQSLDSDAPDRFGLWRASDDHVRLLAPAQLNGTIAYVRSGVTHWYELDAQQRESVASRAATLLRTDRFFGLALPFFEATGRFDVLRRANPGTVDALTFLRQLAATNGLFDDYRDLRAATRERRVADYRARIRTMPHRDMLADLPNPITVEDKPVVQLVLDELNRRPLDADPGNPAIVDELVAFAIDHHMTPLNGLDAITLESGSASDATRARLALAVGDADRARAIELASTADRSEWRSYDLERAEWDARHGDLTAARARIAAAARSLDPHVLVADARISALAGDSSAAAVDRRELERAFAKPVEWRGLCGDAVCRDATASVFRTNDGTLTLRFIRGESDEVSPYVEVYVDDQLATEAEVADTRELTVPLTGGSVHDITVRLVNPITRNYSGRRVRIS